MIPIDLVRAHNVVEKLQAWVEDRDGLSSVPLARFTWSKEMLEVYVGNELVWASRENDIDDLTVAYCKAAFLEGLEALRPFWPEV